MPTGYYPSQHKEIEMNATGTQSSSIERAVDQIRAAQRSRRLLAGSTVEQVAIGAAGATVDLRYAAWIVRIDLRLQRFSSGDRLAIEVRIRPLAGIGRLFGWRTVVRQSQIGGRAFPTLDAAFDEIWFRVTTRPDVIAWCNDGRKNFWWPKAH